MKAVLEKRQVNFTIPQQQLIAFAKTDPGILARRLARKLYANPDSAHLEEVFTKLKASKQGRALGVAYLTAALTAPSYHLC